MLLRQPFIYRAPDGEAGGGAPAAVSPAGATPLPAGGAAGEGGTYTAPDGTLYTRVPNDSGATPAAAATTTPEGETKPAVAADPIAEAGKTAPIKLEGDDPAKTDDKAGETPAEIKTAADYTLTLPEGVTLDNDPVLKSFLDTAVGQKLSNEQVQAIVTDWAPRINAQIQAGQREGWANTIRGWQTEAAQDPEIGGDAHPAVIATVTAAVRKYGGVTGADGTSDTKAMAKFLTDTGAHSHPAFIRIVYRMATLLGEGTPVGTGTGSGVGQGANKNPADVMYPKTAAKAA